MRPDCASDQPLAGEVIEPAIAAVALSRSEGQGKVAGTAGLLEAVRDCDEKFLGHAEPDKTTHGDRVAVDH